MSKNKRQKQIKQALPAFVSNRNILVFLSFLAIVLYSNTLFHEFTLDDAIVITDNEFTQKGFRGLKDIFTKDTFHGFFGEAGKDKLVSGGRYRPFTLAMFAVENAIFGNSPLVHHLINIILFCSLGILCYLVLFKLFKQKFDVQFSTILALASAAIFIAHPIHTEAVANIKGRDEIMTMLGSLGALYILIRKSMDDISIEDYLLCGLLFLIALLSKENAITFVVVAPLVAFIFFKNPIKTALPFLVSAIIFMIIRTSVIGFDLGAAPSNELMNNPYLKVENNAYIPFTSGEKFATIAHTLWKYIQLLIVPWPLTHDYYPNHIDLKTFTNPTAILGLLSYLGLGIISILGILKKKTWGFFTAYYLITISIVSNIVFPIGTHMSERFIFMPSLAYAGLMSMLLFRLPRKMAIGTTMVLVCINSFITINRNMVWKDNYTLFTTDANTSLNSAKVNNAAGGAISDAVRDMTEGAEKTKLIERGHKHLSRALETHPNYVNAYLLKGNMFFYQQKYQEAIQMYDQSLRIDPAFEDASKNKFLALRAAGRYYGEKENNLTLALSSLEQALAIDPNDYETNRLLGTCYGIMGNHRQAVKFFKKCSELQPNNASIFVNLAKAYEFVGDEANAKAAAKKANALQASNK